MESPLSKMFREQDAELESTLKFLEKTTGFRRTYPNNKFSDPLIYGLIMKKTVYAQIDSRDYQGEITFADKNKNCEVYLNGGKYSFVYPNDRDEVVLTRIFK
jgi:hypothetical protein